MAMGKMMEYIHTNIMFKIRNKKKYDNAPDNLNTSSSCSVKQWRISRTCPVRFVRISPLRQKPLNGRHILTSHSVMEFRARSRGRPINIIFVTHSILSHTLTQLNTATELAVACLLPSAFVLAGCGLLPPHGEGRQKKQKE